MRSISEAGLLLIKQAEGLRLAPYQDSKGVWTIGYGHTKGITQETDVITREEAEELLHNDLEIAQGDVERLVKMPLTDNQYSALVSLVFNTGADPLRLTLGRKLNSGDYSGAADEFLKWSHAGGEILPGLLKRRGLERGLFLKE